MIRSNAKFVSHIRSRGIYAAEKFCFIYSNSRYDFLVSFNEVVIFAYNFGFFVLYHIGGIFSKGKIYRKFGCKNQEKSQISNEGVRKELCEFL